jgi:hypothetical protein
LRSRDKVREAIIRKVNKKKDLEVDMGSLVTQNVGGKTLNLSATQRNGHILRMMIEKSGL